MKLQDIGKSISERAYLTNRGRFIAGLNSIPKDSGRSGLPVNERKKVLVYYMRKIGFSHKRISKLMGYKNKASSYKACYLGKIFLTREA